MIVFTLTPILAQPQWSLDLLGAFIMVSSGKSEKIQKNF